jgi:hypothetical protein
MSAKLGGPKVKFSLKGAKLKRHQRLIFRNAFTGQIVTPAKFWKDTAKEFVALYKKWEKENK